MTWLGGLVLGLGLLLVVALGGRKILHMVRHSAAFAPSKQAPMPGDWMSLLRTASTTRSFKWLKLSFASTEPVPSSRWCR